MTTDFRALCVELLYWADKTSAHYYVQPEVLVRARAALAQPELEVVGPTARELKQIFDDQSGYIGDEQVMWHGDFAAAARAVLARWGRPAAQSVPVSEAAKLVAWLRKASRAAFMDGWPNEESINLTRAADLLERLSPPQPS